MDIVWAFLFLYFFFRLWCDHRRDVLMMKERGEYRSFFDKLCDPDERNAMILTVIALGVWIFGFYLTSTRSSALRIVGLCIAFFPFVAPLVAFAVASLYERWLVSRNRPNSDAEHTPEQLDDPKDAPSGGDKSCATPAPERKYRRIQAMQRDENDERQTF